MLEHVGAIAEEVIEPESGALRRYLREPERVSCGLARTEVLRAVRPVGASAAAQLVAPSLTSLVTYDRRMAEAAASLGFANKAPA